MKCQYCKSVCIKYGRQKSGIQKYYCKNCNKHQQEEYTYKVYYNEKRKLISKLIISNCGILQIASALDISPTTVIRQIKKDAAVLLPPPLPYGGIYEVDEIKTYCGRKENDLWVVYGIELRTGRTTILNIGKRTKETLRKVINFILMTNPEKVYTDRLRQYGNIIPKQIHMVSGTFLNK